MIYSNQTQSYNSTNSTSNTTTKSTSASTTSAQKNTLKWGGFQRSYSLAYNGYHKQLLEMNTYPEKYDANKYTDIQNKMRQIRLKCEEEGWAITKSKYD